MNYKEYCNKCERDGIKMYTVAELIAALQQCPQDAVVATSINVDNPDWDEIDQYGSDMFSVAVNAKGNRVTLQGGYIGVDLDNAHRCINPAQNVLVLERKISKGTPVDLTEPLDKYIIKRRKDSIQGCDDPADMERVMRDDLHFEEWVVEHDVQKIGHAAIIQPPYGNKMTVRRYVLNPYYNNTK